MGNVRKKKEGGSSHRRRYRLNKKKFMTMLLVLGCLIVLIAVAVESLKNAVNVDAVVMGAGIPNVTEYIVQVSSTDGLGLDATNETNPDKTNTLSGRLIVLDAGHGGFDPGAIGAGGTREDELNLAVTQYLKTELEGCGAQVIMIREDENAIAENKDDDMAARRQIIEESGSDIVISIHMNSYEEDPDVSGPVVLFMPGSEEGKRLAETMQDSLNEKLDTMGTARSESLYILESGNQPCVLVECGYISNEQEERMLLKPDYQHKIAEAIYEGIAAYFLRTETEG